jgi:hypothetical protein
MNAPITATGGSITKRSRYVISIVRVILTALTVFAMDLYAASKKPLKGSGASGVTGRFSIGMA